MPRCENLKAVYDAYQGPKRFRQGAKSMETAELDGFDVVVCDCLPMPILFKRRCISINIGHAVSGMKLYGVDERKGNWSCPMPWINDEALHQIDHAIASSEEMVPIVAGQLDIPEERVHPTGLPRTDRYFEMRKSIPKMVEHTYLYLPTFRHLADGNLPRINWAYLDSLLSRNEQVLVKRHYFTSAPLVDTPCRHVFEEPAERPLDNLLKFCSAVVTDYSSVLFDAYLMGRPVVLLSDDSRTYLDKRGTYLRYPDGYSSRHLTAGWDEEDLVNMLRSCTVDDPLGEVELECLRKCAGACDGHSTERVVKLIESCV